jgi:hypothetical protein
MFFSNNQIRQIEMIGVITRISMFLLMSLLGPNSPFLIIWTVNSIDSSVLTYCSYLKKDQAYTVLNFFWILVSLFGVLNCL